MLRFDRPVSKAWTCDLNEAPEQALDDMVRTDPLLRIETPWRDLNEVCRPLAALAGVALGRLSRKQAEAVREMFREKLTQTAASRRLGISQAAMNQRLTAAGYPALRETEAWFRKTVVDRIEAER